MALSASGHSLSYLQPSSAVEQLLEEICYQRARELRQCLKEAIKSPSKDLLTSNCSLKIVDEAIFDCNICVPVKWLFKIRKKYCVDHESDSGFVMLNASTFWTDLFVRHFLFLPGEHEGDHDDLLFFVRKTPQSCRTRYIPKFETELEVYRKDSKKIPIGDPDVDWEETVYLNLILQQFEYTLTLAICTRTSPKDLQILRRHSQKVYACPSRRQMDSKGETEEFTYPNIFFMVDNFDEIFCDITVRDGEMVCVELVAGDKDGSIQGVIFQGSIRYEALKRVYDARTSLTSKMAQRMSLGWYQGQQRMEFVRMKGPQGKGHAEMAVSKPKGCGAETPCSEPGFSLTDFDDWDDDLEDYPYQQRRMSDPSSNLSNFVRGGRPPKSEAAKSRSENEGLDNYANGYNEIEAGDLRDGSENESEKKAETEKLDDTTYNRLFSMRGFSQAYHFWKESRRAQSVAFNAYLTYVTLSWHHIISDLLENRQPPILTF